MKTLLTIFIPLSLLSQAIFAQDSTAFGFKSGLNVSNFSVAVNSESSMTTGFHLGFFLKAKIGEKQFLRSEVYFSQQGQKQKYLDRAGTVEGSTSTKMSYLNLPVLFEVGRKVTFNVGPQLGLLLAAREKGSLKGKAVDKDLIEFFRKVDFAIVGGVNAYPGSRVSFGARVNYGMSDVYKQDEAPTNHSGVTISAVQNRVFHFFVAVLF